MKILVADDDAVLRKIITRQLESKGFSVISASHGQRAFEILEDNPDISLLITDMQMPGVGGRELIQKINLSGEVQGLPVIIISGVIALNEISDLLELGAARFLPKPVNVQDLLSYTIQLTQKALPHH